MSEENRNQGHNGTGGNGGLFGRLFSKKTDQPAGNGDAGKSLNEMIDEENRDTYPEDAASESRQDADGEEFVFSGLDGELDNAADAISDEDYSDILSEILGSVSDAADTRAEDVVVDTDNDGVDAEAASADLQESDEAVVSDHADLSEAAEASDDEEHSKDGAELLRKIMAFKASERNSSAASKTEDVKPGSEEGAQESAGNDVGANTDVFEDYEYVTNPSRHEDAEPEEAEAQEEATPQPEQAGEEIPADGDGSTEDETDSEPSDGEKPEKDDAEEDDDRDLMLALGYGADGEAATESGAAVRDDLSRHIRDNRPDYAGAFGYRGEEYRSREQTEDIKRAYRTDSLSMIFRAGGTAILALVILIFEFFGNKFGGALSMSDYPTVHILVSMQLLLLAAALSWKQMINGLVGIFRFELTPHSASAAAVIVVLLYDAVLAIAAPESFTLYNFPAVLCIVMSVVYDILDLERQIRAFNSLSSWESCCTLEKADAVELAAALGSSASGKREDASIKSAMRLRHGSFAKNYFSRTNRKNPALKALNYVIAPVVALALVIFLISLAAGRGFVPSANTFTVMVLIAMPVFAMAALIYPFCDLAKNVLKPSEVLLNESEAENYASADAVIFSEDDVFGPRSLMIKRIGLCGGMAARDIFGVLEGASAVFDKVGGTLAGAFRRAAESGSANGGEPESDAEILRVCDGGIAAKAANREYIIGSESFMTLNGITCPVDPDDRAFAEDGGSAVMYIAVDGEVSLKLFVTYTADDRFRSLVSTLSGRGIRPVLVSNDPNLDDALLARMLGELKCPVRVIHDPAAVVANEDGEDAEADDGNKNKDDKDTVDAGLVADGSDWTSLVGALSACGKLCRVSSLNARISLGIIVASVLLAAFLGALGILNGMHSAYVAIYQIICVLPAIISSKLMLN